jgi:hypothetical protein
MPAFALDAFEAQSEAFLRARAWREWQFLSGQRPGRGLVTLYNEDFPDFTSIDLWADLQAAASDASPAGHKYLSSLLASAHLEGRTREFAIAATRTFASQQIRFEDADVNFREAAARWPLIGEVSRRHEIEDGWRQVVRSDLNPGLERWHEALRANLQPLGAPDWLGFWSELRGLDLAAATRLAENVLSSTADVFTHALGIYFGQLDLPLDDAWRSDLDFAMRAPRFDAVFTERIRMPTLIRVFRDLGIELTDQTSLHLEYASWPGVHVLPLDIPREVRVQQRLIGGWQDLAEALRALGMAQHMVHTDPSLQFWERWLGDEAPTLGYGLLMESLVRDKTWLAGRLDYAASEDFRAIAYLAWLWRIRSLAASTLYELRLWAAEPGTSMAADFEETLTAATHVRHFPDDYLLCLLNSPWSTLRSAVALRAEVFAAQLRTFLRSEFDEEYWRSSRAAHFIKDELWRPGRRHTADDLLGFMGYEGLSDPSILTAEFEEVLRPL